MRLQDMQAGHFLHIAVWEIEMWITRWMVQRMP
jgi:hypothetical protein